MLTTEIIKAKARIKAAQAYLAELEANSEESSEESPKTSPKPETKPAKSKPETKAKPKVETVDEDLFGDAESEEKELTIEDVLEKAREYQAANGTDKLKALATKFGGAKLKDMPQANWAKFIKACG